MKHSNANIPARKRRKLHIDRVKECNRPICRPKCMKAAVEDTPVQDTPIPIAANTRSLTSQKKYGMAICTRSKQDLHEQNVTNISQNLMKIHMKKKYNKKRIQTDIQIPYKCIHVIKSRQKITKRHQSKIRNGTNITSHVGLVTDSSEESDIGNDISEYIGSGFPTDLRTLENDTMHLKRIYPRMYTP